ncbi:MAG TPA: ATP-binding protein [Candidatus Baltobacteraceae bacterium]|nr:ATP-binding protein [Candidatus Baltobacteraceae bacterium]
MQLRDTFKKRRRDRFERLKIILPILLAGWIPSILTLIVSYTILRDTLETRILRDRQTLIQLVGHLVGHDLSRSSSVIEYYQTLPAVAEVLSAPIPEPFAQQWLNAAFYSHPQIDGMFITASDGRLIGSIPTDPEIIGKDFDSNQWRDQAAASNEAFVSAVHPRLQDKRLATDIVGAVRAPDRTILGYVGVSVLVERMGRRLSTIEFTDRLLFGVLDQNGNSLFARDFKPNPNAISPESGILLKETRQSTSGHFEREGNLYSFSPIESTGWVAVVEQPRSLAYKPVHDLLGRMTILAVWLILLTAVFAWLGTRFYQRQMESTRRIEREVVFNEKILANMPSGIAFIDPKSHHFLQANDAFAHMAQRFGDLPPGRDITEATCDDVKIAPAGAIERVLSFGTPFQLIEYPLKDKTGMTHFLDINLLRLQGSHETIQGVLYLVEDKTRDVKLRQELIDANAAKDQFLALLSHELRNPLSPVIAMVGELEATIPDSPTVREALEVIRRNVELEARLIDDLLDVTRIAKGKLQLSFETVCVNQILQRAYEICREDIAAKHLEVEFRLRATDTHVEGDPARLQQVFWNLIKNSVKFTPEKGRITIETINPAPDKIDIRIADTGMGIEQERIDKIFNAFEQGQTSITRRFGGLGLGLSISKALIDAHGGKIRVESSGKDQGSTFSLELKTVLSPVSGDGDGARRDRRAALEKDADLPRHRRVLVVDDHQDTCTGMKKMLERRGYQITVAHTAQQAVEKVRTQEFDLLISDIGLPDRSGYELMREVQSTKALPGIALSGFGTEQDVNEALAAGFSGHLTKPINFERLEEAISNLLEPEPTCHS